MEHFDLVVIGAGPGGYPAAIRGAQLGASVALVEKEQLGGTCLNWGCIPTKALIAAAEAFAQIQHGARLGIRVQNASLDYAALIAHKNQVVRQLQTGVRQLLAGNGVKLFTGRAAFKDRQTLALEDGTLLGAKKVVIATGSTSAMPAFLPRHPRVVESRGFLDRDQLPGSLLVLGGGFIGCELACMAALLGVKVTLVELLSDILLLLDPDVRREVRAAMERNLGIRILTGKALENIEADEQSVQGRFGEETLRADLLLSAVGRKPVTAGLELQQAGLETNEQGFIPADACCRTRVPSIFAIGDVTGKVQLAHYATAQGLAAAENALGKRPRAHETLVPNVIFTSPEIGTVGLSEEEAKKAQRPVKTGKFRFAALGKALAAGHTTGFVKWIADATTDQLLGAAAVGPHATELIAEAATAIRAELTAQELGRTIHAHPTFSEAWLEAAHAVHGEAIHAPPKKKP
ncbi:MAG TPA: dihydrolipoyl dehydrogenase [Verrucomicrobiota bacterium]|jgi:dihydrolipoamide dehydrogenase|nr:dihydrolipoyl dehydrogenase [Verrucomicrobiota bacterium]HRT09154.1 dihydrolipoyl dehydrogenase [Candidatus Paceibacterota bacterium]HRT56443.1 dihydrolipoyl dehydrogenase [Candidatus Paceibacterota bacterium]